MIDSEIKPVVTWLLAIAASIWSGCDRQTSEHQPGPETSTTAESDQQDGSVDADRADGAQRDTTESEPAQTNSSSDEGTAQVDGNMPSREMGFGLAVDYAQLETWRGNLRQIGEALQELINDEGVPAAYTVDNQGKPLLSWRVRLLPYLGHAELHKQFRLNEPWNSKHNLPLVAKMPSEFEAPGGNAPAGRTNYVSVWSVKGFIVPPDYPNPGARNSSPNRINPFPPW